MPLPGQWADEARCARHYDLDIFTSTKREDQLEAKTVCAQCPVILDCLMHALETREGTGVWGGMTPNERGAVARALKRDPELDLLDAVRAAVTPRMALRRRLRAV